MKKDKLGYYIYATMLLIAIAMFKNVYLYLITWLLFTFVLVLKFGFPRDKSILKNNIIRIVIISLFSYFIITYGLGMITGFSKNIFNLKIKMIFLNSLPSFIAITCQEIIRFIFARNSQYNKRKYLFLTIILIILDIAMSFNITYLKNNEMIFIFVMRIVLPRIAFHTLYSYISYKTSYVPVLIMRYVLELNVYFLPIFPSLGNYIEAVLGVLYPTFVYFLIYSSIKTYDRDNKYIIKVGRRFIAYPLIAILMFLVFLVSGVGKYKLVAIASGSMEPVYERGDAVIYDKRTDFNNFEIGNILAFSAGKQLVTHRIVGIDKKNGKYIFVTKGDNNLEVDSYLVKEEDVYGIVVYKISYIGMPTIWIQEMFDNL